MERDSFIECKLCNQILENNNDFINHLFHNHNKMKMFEYIIQTKYKGETPLCECGCGEKTIYDAGKKDFGQFKRGHQTRVIKDYFGDPKNPGRVQKIIQTRKEKFASGEYDYIKEAIKKTRKDPNLGKKISEGAKGVAKPKPENFGIGRIHSEETKKKMSEKAINNIIIKDRNHTSKLEKKFEEILNQLDVIYSKHFYAKSIKAFYDFYLPQFNTIIEVDGDFWHCNPNKFPEAIYESQKQNLERDKEKNEWADNNGFKMLRFWESDINENPEKIKNMLQKLKN
jgi:very-short-patch-repair endonuclease